jgi:hypothetical protein
MKGRHRVGDLGIDERIILSCVCIDWVWIGNWIH